MYTCVQKNGWKWNYPPENAKHEVQLHKRSGQMKNSIIDHILSPLYPPKTNLNIETSWKIPKTVPTAGQLREHLTRQIRQLLPSFWTSPCILHRGSIRLFDSLRWSLLVFDRPPSNPSIKTKHEKKSRNLVNFECSNTLLPSIMLVG